MLKIGKVNSRPLKTLQFYSVGDELCILWEIFLWRNAYQVTYFHVSLKRNDPSDAAKNDNFVTRVRKYPRCENIALRNLLSVLISRQKKYTPRNLNHNDARGKTFSRQNNLGQRLGRETPRETQPVACISIVGASCHFGGERVRFAFA